MEPTCQVCHVIVRPTDFFCYNCGRNLHEAPRILGVGTQIAYYAGSVLMPPIGFFWGIKFLREKDDRVRRVGLICIALTVVSLLYFTVQVLSIYKNVRGEVQAQTQSLRELF